MSKSRISSRAIRIHEDYTNSQESIDGDAHMEESRDPLEESGCTHNTESEEDEVDEAVAEDIQRFESSFKSAGFNYRLINRIGEGTFSTVYKAEDLQYHEFDNSWDYEERDNTKWISPSRKRQYMRQRRRPRFVAIKKIYVTSSPARILNELALLHDLRDSDSVCPLITAFRHQDQVIAILPYFQHRDFREYFRKMSIHDTRLYFKSLFTALSAVHSHGILHRDIKPTNFLYNPDRGRGVLVDFGLAEKESADWQACMCLMPENQRQYRRVNSYHYTNTDEKDTTQPCYPRNDNRASRRANRAGTRGFRAPEVLFKCTAQTCAIDVWSAGVILLTILAQRFPFFHSADDVDALLELTQIFGKRKMRAIANLHGQVFETNIPSYSESGHTLEKIILWATDRAKRDEQGNRVGSLSAQEKEAVDFLAALLECDGAERITAADALFHPFLLSAGIDDMEDHEDKVDLIS